MTTTSPTVDDLAQLLLPLACTELRQLMNDVPLSKLNPCEVVSVLEVLRNARDRVKAESTVQLDVV